MSQADHTRLLRNPCTHLEQQRELDKEHRLSLRATTSTACLVVRDGVALSTVAHMCGGLTGVDGLAKY